MQRNDSTITPITGFYRKRDCVFKSNFSGKLSYYRSNRYLTSDKTLTINSLIQYDDRNDNFIQQ